MERELESNQCLGECGESTTHESGYCINCRPEEDVTEYDLQKGANNEG